MFTSEKEIRLDQVRLSLTARSPETPFNGLTPSSKIHLEIDTKSMDIYHEDVSCFEKNDSGRECCDNQSYEQTRFHPR